MEYQKVINLLGNAQNEPSKFRARNWIEINHKWQGTYNKDKQIKFKTSTIRSGLCDYRMCTYLLVGLWQLQEKVQIIMQNNEMKEIKE